jgi:hypothetical protein
VREYISTNSDIRRVVDTARCGFARKLTRWSMAILIAVAALLATGRARAQIPTTGFAIDRHTLAEISTIWIAVDATWSLGQPRNVPDAVGGELVGRANGGSPINTLPQVSPSITSLQSRAPTSISAENVARNAVPPAPASELRSRAEADSVLADFASVEQIVREIKDRIPYFQFCVNASRRRGGPEPRRLVAVWSIAPDGAVKELKLNGVADVELATCIQRTSRRPLPVGPGVELIIPTPIVFVR